MFGTEEWENPDSWREGKTVQLAGPAEVQMGGKEGEVPNLLPWREKAEAALAVYSFLSAVEKREEIGVDQRQQWIGRQTSLFFTEMI